MAQAIELIVDTYVRLKDQRALEDLRAHRRKLLVDLQMRAAGYDVNLPLTQLREDIAVIEAGLERLNPSPGREEAQ